MRSFRRYGLAILLLSAPAEANFVSEPSFDEIMSESQVVLIGTVTATAKRGGEFDESLATLSVIRALKGETPALIEVVTSSRIAEMNPRCCERGATYMMFLRHGSAGAFVSAWGAYGMRRIGGPGAPVRVLP